MTNIKKLERLVAYKILQLTILTKTKNHSLNDWGHMDSLFKRENHYAQTCGIAVLSTPAERAMWAYYCLLEKKIFNIISSLKTDVADQLKIHSLGSSMVFKQGNSSDDDHK